MFCLKDHGMPGVIWRDIRLSYKSKIIDDKAEQIPEHIAQHLRSDMERFAYKMAKQAVQKCLDNRVWDTQCRHPENLVRDLSNLDMNASSESIRKGRLYDYLQEIHWHAAINNILNANDLENRLKIFSMQRYNGGYKEVKKERLEKIKTREGTYEIKGSKGDTYLINEEDQICTCPGFRRHFHCKHLRSNKFEPDPRSLARRNPYELYKI